MAEETVESAWCVASQRSSLVKELCKELRVPQLVARVLVNRGLRDPEAARRFLHPSSLHLEAPTAFRQMDRAVDRILVALEADELIVIQGDYDVDGSASAALLVNLFRLLKARVEASIPIRSEGYGLNEKFIRETAARGVTLLITCDNGTTAIAEIALANELGIDTIITDHHTVGERLPDAVAILNPHVESEKLEFRPLCGAGVAFKLAWAVLERVGGGSQLDESFKAFLAGAQSLVALASIADVVPLTGENRVLTAFGLNLMAESPNPGIRALMEICGLNGRPNGRDVSFKLAPRLNAGGRMGHERLALELLTAQSYGDAVALAQEMEVLNRKRQTVDREITKLAEGMVRADESYRDDRVLVLGHDDFDAGVVGIVAARMTRTFHKPAVLVAFKGETGRGSGRSIRGFHLYNALNDCSHLLSSFGGHQFAAGLEIRRDKIDALRQAVNEVAERHILQADYQTPTLDIDAEIPLTELSFPALRLLEHLEPFGEANPEPVFLATGVEIVSDPKVVGRGRGHLTLIVRQDGPGLKAIGFGMGPRATEFSRGQRVRIAFTPRISEWRGRSAIELELKDIRPEP